MISPRIDKLLEHVDSDYASVLVAAKRARQVREALPDAVLVFIAPPSTEALRARLVGRGTDAGEQIEERLRTAERELEARPEFAHVVVNDRLEHATDELAGIVEAALAESRSATAKVKVPPRRPPTKD